MTAYVAESATYMCVYAGDDPVNEGDPSGLMSEICRSWSTSTGQGGSPWAISLAAYVVGPTPADGDVEEPVANGGGLGPGAGPGEGGGVGGTGSGSPGELDGWPYDPNPAPPEISGDKMAMAGYTMKAVEAIYGGTLTDVQIVDEPSYDAVGKLSGQTTYFDATGNPRASLNWGTDANPGTGRGLLDQIPEHVGYAQYVPVDLRGFTQEQIDQVVGVLNKLNFEDQVKIIPVGFNWFPTKG